MTAYLEKCALGFLNTFTNVMLLCYFKLAFKKNLYLQTYPYNSPALLIQQQVPVGYQPAYNYQVCSSLEEAERLLAWQKTWIERTALTGVWSSSFCEFCISSALASQKSKVKKWFFFLI